MKPKAITKIVIDVLMTLALLFLMGYQFWANEAHEWVGACMLALFIVHNVLNVNWYRNLFRGKYTPMRVMGLCVNVFLLVAILAQMRSGITMSGHVFAFLPAKGGMALARRLHILGAYWGFTLMSLHLGMHWGMFVGIAKKDMRIRTPQATIAVTIVGALIAAYGVHAFAKRDLLAYMFLKTEFVFMDFSESILLFYLDYLAMMGLFIFIAHYCSKALRKCGEKKRKKANAGNGKQQRFSETLAKAE
jgi:hypothetical protein